MYSYTTDGNYKIVKILNAKQYPNQDNYYSNLNQNNINTPYNFQIPIDNRSEQNLYPMYIMNSERYFPNDRIIFGYKNNYNNYNRNIYHLNKMSNDFNRFNNFQNTDQDEKFYYNEKVIVHKRNINSIKNYNNNSIHFIRTSSNKKNDNKKK
jgi:hypothetical protein